MRVDAPVGMAADKNSREPEDGEKNGSTRQGSPNGKHPSRSNAEDDEEEDDEDEEEPRLKYAPLTKHLTPLYRNGDASSVFLVAGDKMVGDRHTCNWRID